MKATKTQWFSNSKEINPVQESLVRKTSYQSKSIQFSQLHDKLSQLKQQLKTCTIPLSGTASLGSLVKISKGCGDVSLFTVSSGSLPGEGSASKFGRIHFPSAVSLRASQFWGSLSPGSPFQILATWTFQYGSLSKPAGEREPCTLVF